MVISSRTDNTGIAADLINSVGTQHSEQQAADEFEAWGYDRERALEIARVYRHLSSNVESYLRNTK